MIAAVVTALVAVIAVAFVAAPLRQGAGVAPEEDDQVDVLRERQETAVEALRELDYERQIGKLSDTEYFSLRDAYARRAMALLKLLDQREAARDQALEQAVAERRVGLHPAGGGASPALAGKMAPPAPRRGAGRRSTRRWVLGTAGGTLALIVALVLLTATIRGGAGRATVIGTVPLQTPTGLTFVPGSKNALLAVGGSGLALSTDGGASWQPVTSLLATGQVRGLAPAPDGQGVQALVQMSNGKSELQRSTDGGRTWQAATTVPTVPAGTRGLVAVPGTPPLLFAATASGVEESADQGATWGLANGFVNGLLPAGPVAGLAYAATADTAVGPRGQTWRGLLYAATDHGLYKSNDGGMSWFSLPLDGRLVAVAVDPGSPSVVVAMDVQGRIFRSRDNGASWGG